jgi:uncharacterized membrane protein
MLYPLSYGGMRTLELLWRILWHVILVTLVVFYH